MSTIINWKNVGLGTKTDIAIAKELSVSPREVGLNRRKLGIPIFQKYPPKPKIDWDSVGLGLEPDEAIAKKLGPFSRRDICLQRNKRNIPPFIGYILTQENIPCRSLQEAMYDAYLHWKNIDHKHEVKIDKYRADFQIGKEYHEVAGMLGYRDINDLNGSYRDYAKKLHNKLKNLETLGYKIKVLTVKEVENLYDGCPLNIKFKIDHKCLACDKECNTYLMKGRCNKCYMKHWHNNNTTITHVCGFCKKEFSSSNHKATFCSLECYHKDLETTAWPSNPELIKMVETYGYNEIASKLKVKKGTLYQRVTRAKMRI